jgi:GNAT superfamily N-acetyltransferase
VNPISIRLLARSDLDFADSLRAIAGWNQTLDDWNRFLTLDPASCFVAEHNGNRAGTAVVMIYGAEVAWIGMILVHPDFRRRGIGRFLMEHCLGHLRERGVRCVKLDASPFGKPLYEQLGFREEWGLSCWVSGGATALPGGNNRVRECTSSDLGKIVALDAKVFGAARADLLRLLFQQSAARIVLESDGGLTGFGFMRRGSQANQIGPVAALDPEAGTQILGGLLARADGNACAWIPHVNEPAMAWAKESNLLPKRNLTRMFLRENAVPGSPQFVYAIAGPDLG